MEERSNFYVYCWGKNKEGELSVGHQRKLVRPQACKTLNNYRIKQISSSGHHSAVVTEQGELLLCGSALHGKLGVETQYPNILKFTKLKFQDNYFVQQVACGDYHTLCLLNDGRLLSWGGTLHGKTAQFTRTPGLVQGLQNKNIIYVDCGDFHSAALSIDGELYTWGGGGAHFNKGQLGHGHKEDIEKPELVQEFLGNPICKISCGGFHMMALTYTNELYGWGSGQYGENGYGDGIDSLVPRQVTINYNQYDIYDTKNFKSLNTQNDFINHEIQDLKCGGHHSLVLLSNGLMYSTGYNSHGQLGLGNIKNQLSFKLVYALTNTKVVQIEAGWNHSLVLTNQGYLYSSGYGSNGQLGLGNEDSNRSFQYVMKLQGKSIRNIHAGGDHSWVILDYNNPLLIDYEMPQPLKSPKQSRNVSNSNSRNASPFHSKNSKDDAKKPFNQQLLSLQQMQAKQIQQIQQQSFQSNKQNNESFGNKFQQQPYSVKICFSEIDYSHRFMQVKVKLQNKKLFNQMFDEYIQNLMRNEQGLKCYNLKEVADGDIVEEYDNQVVNEYQGTQGSLLSYTGMLVNDLKQWQPVQVQNTLNYERIKSENYGNQGTLYFLTEETIKQNGVQSSLAVWIDMFKNTVGQYVEDAQFMELRPISFK